MKLVYLAQIKLMDGWAHTVQIMKMCEAFSKNGADVTLLIPYSGKIKIIDAFEYYGIKHKFKIKRVPYVNLYGAGQSSLFYYVKSVSFIFSAKIYLFFHRHDVIYTREFYTALFFKKVFLEKHSFPDNLNFFHKVVLKRIIGLVALTSFIKNNFIGVGVDKERITVAHSAINPEDFNIDFSKQMPVLHPSLSKDDYVIGYIGTLKTMGMEKGVKTAIKSLKYLPLNHKLYIVGGEIYDINFYKNIAKEESVNDRVVFVGKVPQNQVPNYIVICNVLVAPFPKNKHYSYYMSPLKIFEYMISKKPMIVSDLPVFHEVLDNNIDSLFVPPDDEVSLANAIKKISKDTDFAEKISKNAYDKVITKYTWEKRAQLILNFISK